MRLFFLFLLLNIISINSFLLPLSYNKYSIKRNNLNYYNQPFTTDLNLKNINIKKMRQDYLFLYKDLVYIKYYYNG